jgi:predicted lipoprotein
MARQMLPVLLIAAGVMLVGACTVVKIEDEVPGNEDQYATWMKTGTDFRASVYVESIWDEQMVPIFTNEAIDYQDLMEALRNDRPSAVEKFGLRRQTGEPFYIFKVRGTAVVVDFDDSSRNGVIRVDSDPTDGATDVVLQVGPVIRGTVLRDSVEFIRFTDVGNQLQFADLAKELNNRMMRDSIEPIDLAGIKGKRIAYIGAFRLEEEQPIDEIVVTPLSIELIQDSDG